MISALKSQGLCCWNSTYWAYKLKYIKSKQRCRAKLHQGQQITISSGNLKNGNMRNAPKSVTCESGMWQFKSNQINSRFSAPPTSRTTTHYIVQLVRSLELATVGSSKEECFQAALESWRGTHRLEFCWQPIPRLRSSDGERPLTEFQTGLGDDIIAVGRGSKSRPRWDIGDCSQHISRVGWRTKHIIGHIGDDFYRSDDPTNSVKHWRTIVGQSTR